MNNPFAGTETPGMASMADPLGFIKKLWGSMNVPGMVAPPMSLDELDKKIQDLKTVESWLTVNMNMLRGTIQALEVQRATIATLQSLGETFAHHAQQASAAADMSAASPASDNHHADWPMPPGSAAANKPAEEPPAPTKPEADKEDAGTAAESAAGPTAAFANPAAWWNLLQDQFKQAVSKAMEGEDALSSATQAFAQKDAGAEAKAGTQSSTATRTGKPSAKAVKTRAGNASAKAATQTAKAAKPATKPARQSSAKAATKPVTKAAAKSATQSSVRLSKTKKTGSNHA